MTLQSHRFASADRIIPERNGRRKRVLFVINSLTGGGAERVMTTLLTNSKDRLRRYEIALAVLDDGPRAFKMPEWLRIFQLDCKGKTLSSIRSLDQVVREYEPAITSSFLTRANFASCTAMMKLRLPRIISERTSTPAHLGGPLRQGVTKLLMRALSSSDPRRCGFIGCCRQDLRQLRRAIECDRDSLEPGRRRGPGARRRRAGRSADRSPLYRCCRPAGEREKLFFARSRLRCGGPSLPACDRGRRAGAQTARGARCKARPRQSRDHAGVARNPYPLVSKASLFALSSDIEGFPNALVEALALGVPAVATNCRDGPAKFFAGTSADAVQGLSIEEAGILTPVGDVDSYARALKLAMQEPVLSG